MRFSSLFLALCKVPCKIKNVGFPSCIHCVHFIEYKTKYPEEDSSTDELGRCRMFGKKNLVTGVVKHDFADLCRNNEKLCGLEGRYFEVKSIPDEA